VPYANGVHYDSEEQRRPLLHTLISERVLAAAYATDDGAGVLYRGTDFVEAVAENDTAGAYFVETVDGTVTLHTANSSVQRLEMNAIESFLHVITDPHLGGRASPLSFIGPARRVPAPARADELPRIDVALISHNHYDHLDTRSIRHLLARNPHMTCCAPLGLGAWLRRRGVSDVQELDWWQRIEHDGVEVHCVPAQHWSSRTLFDRNRTLWCGWVVRAPGASFYFAGDTGYTPRLAEVAARLGPPDLAALPIGAYAPRWFMRGQHVDPPEAVRIHEELLIRQSLAIHWGTFELADDSLDEPPAVLRAALAERGLSEETFWLLRQGEARCW